MSHSFPDSSVGKECRRPWFNSWIRKIHWRRDRLPTPVFLGFPCVSAGKESTCNAGDLGLIPGLGRSPGEGKGYPLQYSGLENSMDCIVHEVTKSQTEPSGFYFHNLSITVIGTVQSESRHVDFGWVIVLASVSHTHPATPSFCFFFFSWRLLLYNIVVVFVIHWQESAMGLHVFPIPIPPTHHPLRPIPLGLPSAPGPRACLMHPTWAGDLFHPR